MDHTAQRELLTVRPPTLARLVMCLSQWATGLTTHTDLVTTSGADITFGVVATGATVMGIVIGSTVAITCEADGSLNFRLGETNLAVGAGLQRRKPYFVITGWCAAPSCRFRRWDICAGVFQDNFLHQFIKRTFAACESS